MNNSKVLHFGPLLFYSQITDAQLESVKQLLNKRPENNYRYGLAGHLEEEFLIDPQKLEQILLPTFEEFYKAYHAFYYKALEQQIINKSWVNFMKKGDYNPWHSHSGCDWSSVLYISIPEKLREEQKNHVGNSQAPGGITFLQELTTIPYSINSHNLYPGEKDIYIFPSLLQHQVIPFKSDGERITVAFNMSKRSP